MSRHTFGEYRERLAAEGGNAALPFLGRQPPPWFELRTVTFGAGSERAFDRGEWSDAIVVVERGEIELVCEHGTTGRFGEGDILWLIGLPLRALCNRRPEPAALVAVARRRGCRAPAV